MSGVHLRAFLGRLRHRLHPQEAGLSDGRLLERFVSARDEAAFELLVWRHGGMVLNVCRRLLFRVQDIEDAFQATFLVLLRKAATVSKRDSVAAWLHRVAFRVALRAREAALRRQRREKPELDFQTPSAAPVRSNELRPLLDEELNRLPARYRAPLVLCYLQGRTNEEAARELGCPCGTVFSRLARGRELLRSRLVRRGVTVSAGLLATMLGQEASASVPAGLLAPTLRLTSSAASGMGATISPQVLQLTKGVIQAMFVTKLKTAAAWIVVVLVALCAAPATYDALAAGADAEQSLNVTQEQTVQESQSPQSAQRGQGAQRPQTGQGQGGRGGGGAVGQAREHSVANSPPVVVKTIPQAGDTQVDAAATTELRVTFSKDMIDGNWSWTQVSKEAFPKTTGKPRFDKDKRTCILPVKLEPGKTYVIWLNPPKFQSFMDPDGNRAVFYPLVFETKP